MQPTVQAQASRPLSTPLPGTGELGKPVTLPFLAWAATYWRGYELQLPEKTRWLRDQINTSPLIPPSLLAGREEGNVGGEGEGHTRPKL